MALLRCENLNFSYPVTENCGGFSLSQINFSVSEGEILLLYGESGSGKSTLLRILKPELAPFGEKNGGIFFGGKPLFQLSERESAEQIGYVGQNPEAAPVTERVLTELAFLPQNLGLSQEDISRKIAEISAFFGLEPIIGDSICELSGGQKQLVNLAAVMVANPKLLLLDEPTSQLDPLSAERFWQVVRRIRTELGTAIVICEHRTEHFFADCDRILYIENGKQRFVLPPNEAANALKNSEMLDGFPCAIRISSAVGDENQPLLTSAEAARYIKNRYSQSRIDTHFGENDSRSQTELSPALEAKNISFRYDRYGRDVLCGLDFTAYFGEITAICGANGTGKSTLLKLLAGVFRPQEGRICVDGKRISSYKGGSLYRNMLAMLPQNPCDILIEETVLGELSHSPNGENYQREEIDSLLERLGIAENLLDSHPFDLSGGEVQRVALAKLLLTKPRILLLDEPTKGLDPVCKRRLSEILRRLAEEGTAVIFVTHDLDFAAEVSDRTALVFGGRVVTAEPTVEFLQKNYVYTTSAARIGRAVFPTAVSGRRLISACLEAERERDGR